MTSPILASNYTLDFSDITLEDVGRVGGKNASLGEMFGALTPAGVGVFDGFATTADAYWRLLHTNDLEARLRSIFSALDAENLAGLAERVSLPADLRAAILAAYDRLCQRVGREPEMAVRSSATGEGKRVLAAMAANGLRQGEDGLEVSAMCEVPSNAVLAEEFLEVFDGFSVGSNNLTQLTLGLDRDSGTIAHLFDERNDAVCWLIARAIRAARKLGKPIGICGQAPSDYPEFAVWLMSEGIDSISLNPDVAIATALRVAAAERETQAIAAT